MPDNNDERDAIIDVVMGKEIEYLTFPSHFDVAIKIKQALSDYAKPIEYVAEAIKRDPLISLKILQEASRRNKGGIKVLNLAKAINILGFEHVKRITVAMVCRQIDQSKMTIKYTSISRLIWLNSLYTASAAHVLADNLTSFDPEEAFMCGLMLNIGAFYLLHQACMSPVLRDDFDLVIDGIDQYYLSRTIDILTLFEMSPVCIAAMHIEKGNDVCWPEDLCLLRDLIKTANVISTVKFPWITSNLKGVMDDRYVQYLPEIEAMFVQLKNNEF